MSLVDPPPLPLSPQASATSPKNEQNTRINDTRDVVDACIDPNLDKPISTSSPAVTTATGDEQKSKSSDGQDYNALKRTYLSLLPTNQLVDIILSLDLRATEESQKHVWPSDLKSAVVTVAVAAILGSGAKDKGKEALEALGIEVPASANDVRSGEEARPSLDERPQTSTPIPTAPSNGISVAEKRPVDSSTASKTVLAPPPTPITAPTTSTFAIIPPNPQQVNFASPYASGSFSYQHTTYNQAFFDPPPPPPPSASSPPGPSRQISPPNDVLPPLPPPPGPPPTFIGPPGDDDDLPSYEDMLVQALLVHNDPAGTAPKELFQWMAATYPLQANFRPSASQALQKAYKRGRFEKNAEGKYRLNASWQGGHVRSFLFTPNTRLICIAECQADDPQTSNVL